jgi:ADP-ribose pyrophosphatase YjhB (NUDIX family)
MATERRFASFSRNATPPRTREVPEGGMCLSAFVVLSQKGNPNNVLMGKINKNAQWDHLGALDAERVERHSKGWMLPSSHLILYESPQDAARRILREQLKIYEQKLDGPTTFAEAYGPLNHWDFEFIFQGTSDPISPNDAWTELKFVDATKLKVEEIVRAQADVLASIGKWKPR